MNWNFLREVYGKNYRQYVEPFSVQLPQQGLTLLNGVNRNTGDSSDSGKSGIVLAIAHLFGGCPYPATELQTWHTEEPMMLGAVLETADGEVRVERCGGLSLKRGKKTIRGKAAEAELDRIFGMDAKMRALTTYRGQGADGLFLSMSDEKQKEFLTRVLRLDRFEKVAKDAEERAKALKDKVLAAEGKVAAGREAVDSARDALALSETNDSDEARLLVQEASKSEQRAAQFATEAKELLAKVDAVWDAQIAKTEPEQRAIDEARVAAANNRTKPQGILDAEAELEKVKVRLKKVATFDAKARAEVEKGRGAIRTQIAYAKSRASDRKRVETDLKEARHQHQHLSGAVCFTCGQAVAPGPDLEAKLAEIATRIDTLGADLASVQGAEAKLVELTAELAGTSDFEPHPFGPKLMAKETELQLLVKKLTEEEQARTSREMSAFFNKSNKLRAAAEEAATLATAALKAQAQGLADLAETQRHRAKGLRERSSQLLANIAVQAERERAYDEAQAALASAESVLAEYLTAQAVELDTAVLTGRKGFLGTIFQRILGEIADATNAILGRVANVRHITFQFDPAPESGRITPQMFIDGKQRPFGSGLSGGMGNAVKLAVDLAVGEVVAKERGYYPGWLILDESFNGLGPVAKESCMEVLQAYADQRLIIVIDHSNSFKGLFSQVIEVESLDGRSRVK